MALLSLGLVVAVGPLALAAPAVQMVVSPHPVQAPAETTFIVVSAHLVPKDMMLQIAGQKAVHVAIKKEAPHEYAGAYLLRTTGTLKATALTASHQVVISRTYTIHKAPSHLFSKILVGIVFFGVSIWYWRRSQQRYAPPKK